MITLQLGEKTFEVQDFRFTHLKQAAPIMDRIAERTLAPPEGGFTVATVETGADMLEVLAIDRGSLCRPDAGMRALRPRAFRRR
jgi:hypothetical protein